MSDIFVDRAALLVRNTKELEPFVEWLHQQKAAAVDRLVFQLDGKAMRNAQGRVQAFNEVLNLIEDAPKRLDKAAQR